LPDESNWTIWSAHFDFGGQSITDFTASLTSTQAAAVESRNALRPDRLLRPARRGFEHCFAVIESIGAYPTADEYCSLYMPKIQQALEQRGIAITLDCKPNADGDMTMQIISKPADMSQDDAQKNWSSATSSYLQRPLDICCQVGSIILV